ncbi:hypothetical protein GQX74_011313 [Glossina fuscipes]|nr:hypothetical protein GQX74_011313 [Glossina fuscipes]
MKIDFEGINKSDVDELLTADKYEMLNEELIDVDMQCANEKDTPVEMQQNLTSQNLSKAMDLVDEIRKIFYANGNNPILTAKTSQNNVYPQSFEEFQQIIYT